MYTLSAAVYKFQKHAVSHIIYTHTHGYCIILYYTTLYSHYVKYTHSYYTVYAAFSCMYTLYTILYYILG